MEDCISVSKYESCFKSPSTFSLPNVFDKDTDKTSSINLSIVSHGAKKHKYMLKDYIKNNKIPDYIIWNTSYKRNYQHWQNSNFMETIELYNSTKNFNFILGYFPVFDTNRIKTIIKDLMMSKKQTQIQHNPNIQEMIKEKGTYYWINKNRSVGKNYTNNGYSPNSEKKWLSEKSDYMKDLYNFLDLTKELNIKVFIIEPPKPINSSIPSKTLPLFVKKLKNKYNHVIISDTFLSSYYPTELFMDRGHLNYNGAKFYTKDILKSFNRAYNDK